MNVTAALLCSDDSPHVRLAEMHASLEAASDVVKKIAASPASRVDFDVEVLDYAKDVVRFLQS